MLPRSLREHKFNTFPQETSRCYSADSDILEIFTIKKNTHTHTRFLTTALNVYPSRHHFRILHNMPEVCNSPLSNFTIITVISDKWPICPVWRITKKIHPKWPQLSFPSLYKWIPRYLNFLTSPEGSCDQVLTFWLTSWGSASVFLHIERVSGVYQWKKTRNTATTWYCRPRASQFEWYSPACKNQPWTSLA